MLILSFLNEAYTKKIGAQLNHKMISFQKDTSKTTDGQEILPLCINLLFPK